MIATFMVNITHTLEESLCFTPETNVKLYINYIKIKKNLERGKL